MKRFFLIIFMIIAPITSAQENWGPAELVEPESWWELCGGPDNGFGFGSPAISTNDSLLFFHFYCFGTSGIAYSHYENGIWQSPAMVVTQNWMPGPGTPFFIANRDSILYFSADADFDETGYGGTDIWAIRKEGNAWSDVWNLGPVVNTDADESSPSIPGDESRLYFMRDHDIMSSEIVDGEFMQPEALPEIINSEFVEHFAMISRDGSRLYFSREISMYSLTPMFVSYRYDDSWHDPIELNENINFENYNPYCPGIYGLSFRPTFSSGGAKMYFGHFEPAGPFCEPWFEICVSELTTEAFDDYPEMPDAVSISVYPNPFNAETRIALDGNISLIKAFSIFDITGQRVRTLPITAAVIWDGTNDSEYPVSSGIYFILAECRTVQRIAKVTLLK